MKSRKKLLLLLLAILLGLYLTTRMEWAKMRYGPDELSLNIQTKSPMDPLFDTKMVDDKRIHYLTLGDRPELPILVFVHGSPGALNAYQDYFLDSMVYERADIIAVDRPGFGYSDFGQQESSLAIQAKLIAAILRDYPNQKKILIGHSMGGPVISKLAIEYPELTDGLVLIAPSISPYLEPSNTWRKMLNFAPVRWLTPTALRVCNQEIIPLKEELEIMMNGWEKIEVPVTVIHGMEDNLVTVDNSIFAEQMLVNSPLVKVHQLEGGNHFILWNEVTFIRDEIFELLDLIEE